MSFRGISGTQAAVDAVRLLVDTAKTYPRCERLGGRATRTDGRTVTTCPCTLVTSPDARCPHATRHEAPLVTLVAAATFATPINEADSVVMTAIGPANVALIRTVLDSEVKMFGQGQVGP